VACDEVMTSNMCSIALNGPRLDFGKVQLTKVANCLRLVFLGRSKLSALLEGVMDPGFWKESLVTIPPAFWQTTHYIRRQKLRCDVISKASQRHSHPSKHKDVRKNEASLAE